MSPQTAKMAIPTKMNRKQISCISSLKIVIASNEPSQFSNIAILATTEKMGLGKLSLANCLLRGEMLLFLHPIRGLKPIEFEPLKSL